MANRLESIWDALRNSMNPEEEQVDPISNSYSQGQGYNYPVPNEWGDSYQTFSNVDTSPMIPVTDKQVVQQPVPQQMSNNITTPFDMASIPHNTTGEEHVAPVEEPGFMSKMGDGISDFWNDEEKMANLAIGLNSMRLNPDANLAKAMETKIESVRQQKMGNKSVAVIRQLANNPNTSESEKARLTALADAVEQGAIKGSDAMTQAMKRESGGVNVNMGNDKYYDQIKSDAAAMQTEYRERGQNARATMNNFNQLDQALSNYGETGPKQDTIQDIRELASSVGMEYLIDEDRLSDGQYLKAVKNKMVAQQLMLQKGPQTDFDAEFAGTYIPGLGISAEANTSLMNASKSISQQQLILSKLVRTARMTQPENAMEIISKADALAEESPMAMKSADGKWTTFIEFYNDPEYAKNTGLERLTAWSEIYKLRMAE